MTSVMPKVDVKSEATRLLDNVFTKMSKFTKPTGIPLYRPQPSDIVIATFPKAGTTLLQNMTYQVAVATGGAPSFDPDGTNFTDIGEVSPWIDFGPEFGIMEVDSSPRIFKTHSAVHLFDVTKSKFIYCVRDPQSYPASWLDFLLDWVSDEKIEGAELREEIFHEFIRRNLLGLNVGGANDRTMPSSQGDETVKDDRSWFSHVKGWAYTPHENILVLLYEDIVKNYGATAEKIAAFMGRELSPKDVETVVSRCDRNKMASDNKFRCQLSALSFGLDREGGMRALAADRPGFKKMQFTAEELESLRQLMKQNLNVESYESLCTHIREGQRAIKH